MFILWYNALIIEKPALAPFHKRKIKALTS